MNLRTVIVMVVTVIGSVFGSGVAAASAPPWDAVAECESGGDWTTDTGNGFYGGLQFTLGTWRSHGGEGMPQAASRETQIEVANRVLADQGWQAWPACSHRLGLR